jgi:hypothetical protein
MTPEATPGLSLVKVGTGGRPRRGTRTPMVVVLVLLLALAAAAQLDGLWQQRVGAGFWRATALAPVVIGYILAVRPYFDRFRDEAVDALRGLATDPEAFERVAATCARTRRKEWLAVGVGVGVGIVLLQPWRGSTEYAWTLGYRVAATAVMGGLIGSVVYATLSGTRLLTRLHHQPMRINVFDPVPLEPVARRSLFLSLFFLGGLSLGVLLIPDQDALGMVLTGTITVIAVTVFFLGLRNTHRVLVEAKQRELDTVRDNLNAVYGDIKAKTANGEFEDLSRLNTLSNVWINYEKRLKDAAEWPFTNSMLRRLTLTMLIPVLLLSTQRVLIESVLRVLHRQ